MPEDTMTLEQLFQAADSVGNRYQTQEEVEEYRAQLDAIRQAALDEGLLDEE